MTAADSSGVEVERVLLAEAAAVAARSVPGVVRLQPGLVGLLKQLAAQAWERATGRPVPDIAGIDVDLRADGSVQVGARIVTAATYRAAEVGADVHAAISTAIEAVTGTAPQVRVRIVEIDLEPQR
ncbi:Asp23/Gls24 family envelope stress response protein [Kribbella sp.]|uniref:Asp23/Gls24 family envelope stress response protein n=1 Tax=Kribbella sp. TaxID=1871183 RepID=UPI002D42321F|nr:Asp23/Gls24 family envelope stress response protein [Kribbella sp.]HZX06125.1 Asp23/Gls24 family envelope stress response protein [Kribbella sp.]